MNYNDEVDHILDDALTEYRDAEPLVGMENRVLQRVRTCAASRRGLCWQWSACAACAAMLAIATWIGWRDRAGHEVVSPEPIMTQRRLAVEAPVRDAAAMVGDKNSGSRRDVTRMTPSRSHDVTSQTRWPRTNEASIHQQFPSPAPLSSEERALLAMAQMHPEVLSHLLDHQDDQQIAIAPINIEPLANLTSGH